MIIRHVACNMHLFTMIVNIIVLVLLVCTLVMFQFFRHIRILHVGGIPSSIYWTVCSWLHGHPVPTDYRSWYGKNTDDHEDNWRDRRRAVGVWTFLQPFFALRGYNLYVFNNPDDISTYLFPKPSSITSNDDHSPYGRCLYEDRAAISFVFGVSRLVPFFIFGGIIMSCSLIVFGQRGIQKGEML